jgi:hypothetical protein
LPIGAARGLQPRPPDHQPGGELIYQAGDQGVGVVPGHAAEQGAHAVLGDAGGGDMGVQGLGRAWWRGSCDACRLFHSVAPSRRIIPEVLDFSIAAKGDAALVSYSRSLRSTARTQPGELIELGLSQAAPYRLRLGDDEQRLDQAEAIGDIIATLMSGKHVFAVGRDLRLMFGEIWSLASPSTALRSKWVSQIQP